MALILFLVFSLLLQVALGDLIREDLPIDICSFSIASSGKRCLLENYASKDGSIEYQCKTSEGVVEIIHEWIETDECIRACGVDRNTAGISSDSLLQPQFTRKLCSHACYENCPNIVDLYFNLALGEGVYLLDLFMTQRTNPHRVMSELRSSGEAAGPISSESYAFINFAPAPASISV